jgi:Bacterial regulatory proteins, gntR family
MFKVSRSPIREALFALENEGTVTTEPYRGAILKPLSTSIFPRCFFYELLDSVRDYLLDGDLLFYRLYLGLRLFGGGTLVHEFRQHSERTNVFRGENEGGRAFQIRYDSLFRP